jgi:hypothetical protein
MKSKVNSIKKKAAKQILTIYEDEQRIGETAFFFKGNEIITNIDGNDGNYRDEYMNCLVESFGIEVKRVDKLSKEQEKVFVKHCSKYNIEIVEPEEEVTDKNYGFHCFQIDSPFGYQNQRFFVPKGLNYSEEFLKLYQKMEKQQRKEEGSSSLWYEKVLLEEGLDRIKPGDGNYVCSGGYLSEYNLVEEIIHPSEACKKIQERFGKKWEKFSDIKTMDDLYHYLNECKCFKLKLYPTKKTKN